MKSLNILVEALIKEEKHFRHLNESLSNDKLHTLKVLNKIKSQIKNPRDVERFIGKYSEQIIQAEEELYGKSKKNLKSATSKLRYAISKGWAFIKKHWGKILGLILIIALALGFKFGLFGKLSGLIGSWLDSGGNDVALVDANAPTNDKIEISTDTDSDPIEQQQDIDNNTNTENNDLEYVDVELHNGDQNIFGYLYDVTPEQAEEMREYLKQQGVTDQKSFEAYAKAKGMLKHLRKMPVIDVVK